MVLSDIEGPERPEKYFDKLFQIHQETEKITYENLNFSIIQFSDSIIISAPYRPDSFFYLSKLISDYQYKLLCSDILIRGALTYGKHFYNDNFLFSAAVIDAYRLESTQARYPRILISDDLFDLVSNSPDCDTQYVVSDNNFKIIDFLHSQSIDAEKAEGIRNLISSLASSTKDTISEKGLWLKEYFYFKFPSLAEQYVRFAK
jgi:hypothetical protein